MDSERRLVVYAALGLLVVYLGIAVAVLVDDVRMRRAMRGRWARIDRAVADVEENSALVRLERQREQGPQDA